MSEQSETTKEEKGAAYFQNWQIVKVGLVVQLDRSIEIDFVDFNRGSVNPFQQQFEAIVRRVLRSDNAGISSLTHKQRKRYYHLNHNHDIHLETGSSWFSGTLGRGHR